MRRSHAAKMGTSRKSAMVSRLLANPSIQIIHEPPDGERCGLCPSNAPDKQVTNGVGGSVIKGTLSIVSKTSDSHVVVRDTRSLKDHSSTRTCFPTSFARYKGN